MNPSITYYLIEQACKRLSGGMVFDSVSLSRNGITESMLQELIGEYHVSYALDEDQIRLGFWNRNWAPVEKQVAIFMALHFKAGDGLSVRDVQDRYAEWVSKHAYLDLDAEELVLIFEKFGLQRSSNGYVGIAFRD